MNKKHFSLFFMSLFFMSLLVFIFNAVPSESAELIDPAEQYQIGLRYLNGDGVKQSDFEAAVHIQIAAIQGYPDAEALYGDMFYFGKGVIRDRKAALDWYRKAADGGSINGYYGLGKWYETEDGTGENIRKSIELYQKAAEQGHTGAQFSLAEHYLSGEYIKKDVDEGLKWAYESAEQDYPMAQYLLGKLFLEGDDVPQNLEDAYKWLKAASDQDYPEAQLELGCMYMAGEGVDQDYSQAVALFRKASEKKLPDAFYYLAVCYENGFGVEADYGSAAELYKTAADLGQPEAQYIYGMILLQGTVVQQDINGAAKFLKLSADQEYTKAISALTDLFTDGYAVDGIMFTFDEKSHYEFSVSDEYVTIGDENNAYGKLVLNGNVSNISEIDGIQAFDIGSGNINISYRYVYDILNAPDNEWHLINDRSKKVDEISLSKNINKGAIIFQTSPDRKNWTTVVTKTNVFSDTPVQMDSFYTSSQIQLSNGCYYRLIVPYELQKKDDDSIFTKKVVEVYEFFMFNSNKPTEDQTIRKQRIAADKVRVETTQGYIGIKPIVRGDPHYGWDLGSFYVSGFTSSVKDDQGNPVFLKNVGDKVTLWFLLEQEIDSLPALDKEGKELRASIHNDNNSDNYFETQRTNFGRGAIITRFTNHNGEKGKPVIYTDFLGANASKNADTQVTLFEEGDYEVALDYAIKTEPRKVFGVSVIPEYSHYRIFFRFSVRNGNCMVYPFDIVTGAELTNTSVTENGFYLDLARSRYLDIYVKKEVITEGANGYTEDIRFNRPARDGESYEDEGLYTITAANKYTNQRTQKIIYVGTNDILSNYVSSGFTVEEIIKMLSSGSQN